MKFKGLVSLKQLGKFWHVQYLVGEFNWEESRFIKIQSDDIPGSAEVLPIIMAEIEKQKNAPTPEVIVFSEMSFKAPVPVLFWTSVVNFFKRLFGR